MRSLLTLCGLTTPTFLQTWACPGTALMVVQPQELVEPSDSICVTERDSTQPGRSP